MCVRCVSYVENYDNQLIMYHQYAIIFFISLDEDDMTVKRKKNSNSRDFR